MSVRGHTHLEICSSKIDDSHWMQINGTTGQLSTVLYPWKGEMSIREI